MRRTFWIAALILASPIVGQSQTIRPTRISQLELVPVTTAQEATMTLADGDVWYNSDLKCWRKRLNGVSACMPDDLGWKIVCPTCQYTTIQAACAALPATGGEVYDARQGNIAITTNPFSGCTMPFVLHLGAGTYQTSVQWAPKAGQVIKGISAGNYNNTTRTPTIIQPVAGFTPSVVIGLDPLNNSASDVFTTGNCIEDVLIDMTNVATNSKIALSLLSVSNTCTFKNVTVINQDNGNALYIGKSANAGAQVSDGLTIQDFYYLSKTVDPANTDPAVIIENANEVNFIGGRNKFVRQSTAGGFTAGSSGIVVRKQANHINLDGVSVAGYARGIMVDRQTGTPAPRWVRITKSTIENFNIGIYCPADGTGSVQYLWVGEGNRFITARGVSPVNVSLDYCADSTFFMDEYADATVPAVVLVGTANSLRNRVFAQPSQVSGLTLTSNLVFGRGGALAANNGTFVTDSLTTGNLNNVLFVDGVKYTTIQAALDAAGAKVVVVPDTYAGAEETSVGANQLIFDLRSTRFGFRRKPTSQVGVFTLEKANESDSTYMFFLRPKTEDGNTNIFFARSPIGGTNPTQAVATIQAHGAYTSDELTAFTDKNLIVYTANAAGSLIDRFRIEALQNNPRFIFGDDLSATADVPDHILIKTTNGILLRKRTGDALSDSQTVIVPSAGAFGFRNNANNGDISAIYKDTSDILYLGNTGTPSVFLNPANTNILRATSSGIRVGDATLPTATLDVLGKATVDSNGIVTRYKDIATVANGLSAEYAQVNLTAQGAAIGATTLYAVPASGAGQYRVCFNAKVTQAATTSSVLGGTNGFQLVYTDQDDSVVTTTVAGHPFNSTTANLALNTTQGQYNGCLFINAKASTNVQYQLDYTSVGATPMNFNLHIRLEAM